MEGTTVLTRSLILGKNLGWKGKNSLPINETHRQKLHGVCLTTAAVAICTARTHWRLQDQSILGEGALPGDSERPCWIEEASCLVRRWSLRILLQLSQKLHCGCFSVRISHDTFFLQEVTAILLPFWNGRERSYVWCISFVLQNFLRIYVHQTQTLRQLTLSLMWKVPLSRTEPFEQVVAVFNPAFGLPVGYVPHSKSLLVSAPEQVEFCTVSQINAYT